VKEKKTISKNRKFAKEKHLEPQEIVIPPSTQRTKTSGVQSGCKIRLARAPSAPNKTTVLLQMVRLVE
jgi:hypothetical protein